MHIMIFFVMYIIFCAQVASIYHISELCDKCPQKVAALVESKYMEKTQNLIKQSKSDVVLRDLLMKHPESRGSIAFF